MGAISAPKASGHPRTLHKVNWVDVVLIGLLLIAAWWGGVTGFVSQAVILVGLVLGFLAGAGLAVWLSQRVLDTDTRAIVAIATMIAVTGIFYAGAAAIGAWAKHRVPQGWPRGVDAAAGTATAMIGVALIAWLLAMPLAESPFDRLATGVKDSFTMAVVQAEPPPRNIMGSLRSALRATGFPRVFDQLPTAFGGQTSAPDPSISADPQVDSVGNSTVKIIGEACRTGSQGSGWVFSPGYVATNAHVVAGVNGPVEIETRRGRRSDGDVVAFDPERDVAVIHAPDLDAPAVDWTTKDAPSDLSVTALGYPQNQAFTSSPGRVRQTLEAKGRDIYDENIVDRNIYEIASRIRPGNSGGPLVSPAGTVYGMVFAASSSDSSVGYALSGSEIAPILDIGLGRDQLVDTGKCLR